MVLTWCAGYEENRRLSFWLSFDPDGQTVKYGKGHHMEARPPLQLLAYQQFSHLLCRKVVMQTHAWAHGCGIEWTALKAAGAWGLMATVRAAQESTLLQHTFTCGRAGPRPVRVVHKPSVSLQCVFA